MLPVTNSIQNSSNGALTYALVLSYDLRHLMVLAMVLNETLGH